MLNVCWNSPFKNVFAHREGGEWSGTNAVFFDGHASWRRASEIVDLSAANAGARWLQWDNRYADPVGVNQLGLEEPRWW